MLSVRCSSSYIWSSPQVVTNPPPRVFAGSALLHPGPVLFGGVRNAGSEFDARRKKKKKIKKKKKKINEMVVRIERW